MVKQDGIEVELVEAVTRQPFKEHQNGKDGLTYFEVEPDAEYFIRIDSRGISRKLLAAVSIDGKVLDGVDTLLDSEIFVGLRKNLDKFTSVTKSFKFMRRTSQESSDASSLVWSGSVQVTIREEKEGRVLRSRQKKRNKGWTDSVDEICAVSGAPSSKLTASAEGSHFLDFYFVGESSTVLLGPVLTFFDLRYCTVPGLVHQGILPAWDGNHRMIPQTSKAQELVPYTQPEKITVESPHPSIPAKEYELFDLTYLPD